MSDDVEGVVKVTSNRNIDGDRYATAADGHKMASCINAVTSADWAAHCVVHHQVGDGNCG